MRGNSLIDRSTATSNINGKYPETVQKDDKLALWKQSKFFQAQEMHLYYIGGIFYVVVGLVIDRSLSKLAKDW